MMESVMENLNNLKVEVKDKVCVITINRPKALNALNNDTLRELSQVIDAVSENEAILGVIITGEGKVFVAGADIRQMQNYKSEEGRKYAGYAQGIFDKIEALEKTVIAAVNGYALGGGFDKLIGENRDFIELKKTGVKASKINFPVLLTGETGTGNIRELQNVIKSAYAVSDDMVIMMCDLPSKMDNISRVAQCNVDSNCSIHEKVENYEKSLIIDVLRKYNWKCSKAAEVMGIHKSLLYKKIKKYEIELNN